MYLKKINRTMTTVRKADENNGKLIRKNMRRMEENINLENRKKERKNENNTFTVAWLNFIY